MRGWGKKSAADKTPARQPRLMAGQGEEYVFRRSRTLTGTTSSNVSPVQTQVRQRDLKSPRLKLHELHAHRRRLSLTFVLVLILSLGSLYAIGTSLATVSVRAEGNVTLSSGEERDLLDRVHAFSTARRILHR